MFGNRRRRRTSNPPPLNGTNTNPSAATAAAQAFLKSQASNASLSSAAAAAALRSRPTTPVSIADIQTKRMLRRSESASSMGSSVAGGSRPNLERRGSNGSMSERTFRDPSPARPVPSAVDAPPVPAIPKNIQQSKAHRRAASLEAPPMRVASPPPNKANGRGSSLGPATTATPPRKTGQRRSNLSSVQELMGIERPESRGSVNFSYPTSSRPTSPISQRRLTSPSPSRSNPPIISSPTNKNLVYDPNTRTFLPLSEIRAIEQRVQDASNQPVKKKKRIAPAQSTGTHLADGTAGGRIRGTAVDAMETTHAQSPTPEIVTIPPRSPTNPSTAAAIAGPSTSLPRKKKKKVFMVSDSDSDQASYAPNSSDNDSDFRPAARTGATLVKKPSIVREDLEGEEEEDYPTSSQTSLRFDRASRPISPTPLPRSSAGRGHGRGQASASAAYAQERQHTRSASQPAPDVSGSAVTNEKGVTGRGSVQGGRIHSVSPARTTHFATTPDSLMVKHQPPARSISPRKSALKHYSSSPRGPSPIGDMPGAFDDTKRQSISEASNASIDDLPVPRKKSVRVSFDEKNFVVGDAASTTAADPASTQQGKRGWFSLGRGKKKDTTIADDNDDEIMKPRPALPSFGSVRERKNTREPVEERQLVKPAESVARTAPAVTAFTKTAPVSPLFTSPTGEPLEFPMGQSNDHVVGAVLSQDAASKNEANISKSREPLPPQVLSVEGTGDPSDSDSTVSGLDSIRNTDVAAFGAAEISPGAEIGGSESTRMTDNIESDLLPQEINGEVPQIAVSHPTPTLEDTEKRREWPDMPGGFPTGSTTSESGSSQRDDVSPTIVEHHPTDPTPATVGIAEPYEGAQPGSPVLGEIAAENHARDSIIMEETEDESVYSDAAEDLSDTEGDRFQSLNAVVESPVTPVELPTLTATSPDSPTARSTKERVFKQSQLSRKSSAPDTDEGWEKAQEYWKGLSADKKRQLEQEAREEMEDSDSTIEAKPAPKPTKKKKAAAQPAQQTSAAVVATQTPAKQAQNGRTYMIQPGSKAEQNGYTSIMRSSMRVDLPPKTASETHIRKSMRGQGSMRGSLRDSDQNDQRGALQKNNRPNSLPASEIKADPAAVTRHVRALSAASASLAAKKETAPPTPTLRRKTSGDSDSSFKRTRPTGGSHFRSSMRAGSVDQSTNNHQQSPFTSSRFSLRSLSPSDSTAGRRPFNTAQPVLQTHMRSSMRSSQGATPTMRGVKPERAKSPIRIPGFGRSSSTKPAKQKPAPPRASRFADSSDEEDARPSFRSRFVDSSDDDDEPLPRSAGLRGSMRASQTVRPVPRPTGFVDGDSSDLPDSDDEKSPTSPKLAKNRPNGTANNQGLTLASGSLRRSGSGRGTMASPTAETPGLRPKNTRRGSLMSILRRKKADPSSKVRKSEIESAARRDTPLERSRSDLQAVRRNDSYNSVNGPSTPKLQKRNNSGSWPLPLTVSPPKIVGGEDGRPFTADDGEGVTGGELTNGNKDAGRPDIGTRRFTATGVSEVDLSAVTGKGKKKKKFQGLRKMFGLND